MKNLGSQVRLFNLACRGTMPPWAPGRPGISYDAIFTIINLKNHRREKFCSTDLSFSRKLLKITRCAWMGYFPMPYPWSSTLKTPRGTVLFSCSQIFTKIPEDDSDLATLGTRWARDIFRCHIHKQQPQQFPQETVLFECF